MLVLAMVLCLRLLLWHLGHRGPMPMLRWWSVLFHPARS
jgi:hypothetical protein